MMKTYICWTSPVLHPLHCRVVDVEPRLQPRDSEVHGDHHWLQQRWVTIIIIYPALPESYHWHCWSHQWRIWIDNPMVETCFLNSNLQHKTLTNTNQISEKLTRERMFLQVVILGKTPDKTWVWFAFVSIKVYSVGTKLQKMQNFKHRIFQFSCLYWLK